MKKAIVSVIHLVFFFTVNAQVSVGPRIGLNNSMAKFSSSAYKVGPLSPGLYRAFL